MVTACGRGDTFLGLASAYITLDNVFVRHTRQRHADITEHQDTFIVVSSCPSILRAVRLEIGGEKSI